MTKGIKITVIVAACCVAAGLALASIGMLIGGPVWFLFESDGSWHAFDNGSVGPQLGNGQGWNAATDSGKETLQSFTEIQMDCDAIELTFVATESDSYEITYECYNGAKPPEYTVKDGVLQLTAKLPVHTFGGFSQRQYRKVTLLYPKAAVFKVVDIECDAGKLKVDRMSAHKLLVDMDAGDVRLDNCPLGIVEISADAGNVVIEGGKADRISIDLDAGNLEAKAFDTGEMTVNADMGSIALDGRLRGDTSLEVSMGSIEVNTGLSRAEYRLKTEATMGNVDLKNGEKGAVETDATNSLTCKTDMGSIKVAFAKQ